MDCMKIVGVGIGAIFGLMRHVFLSEALPNIANILLHLLIKFDEKHHHPNFSD